MNRMLRKTRAGFTIIEMLIVIAVAGILGTIGIGYMISAKPHSELEGAELALSSTLNQARNLALSQEVATKVAFDLVTGEYWIERLDRDSGSWSEETVHTTLPGAVSFASGGITFADDEVLFTPRGTLLSGGSITLASSAGEESTLDGQVATGRFMPGGGHTR
jgi:prepilin-type N-terminal cleavage/methylation domain-containing protein